MFSERLISRHRIPEASATIIALSASSVLLALEGWDQAPDGVDAAPQVQRDYRPPMA
jgi:hypothetical protein